MNSQDTVSKTLIDLSEWTAIEVQENLDRVLPVLQRSLEATDQKALSLQAVQALLGTCLPCVAVHNLEKDILQHALPAATALFMEAIQGIHEALLNADQVINTITSLLNCSIELLNCLESTMLHVISLGRVEVSVVPSLPKVVAGVLHGAFKHVKDSKQLYGALVQQLRGALTALFHKSHKVQMTLLELMSGGLAFNCDYEEDLVTLTDVLETLGRTGEIVFTLDVKAMAELWKGYVNLAQVNADHLRPRLDVAGPVKFLAREVVCKLKAATDTGQNNTKAVTQTLRIGSFALKILNKLLESYVGYLGDCNMELVAFLSTLNLHSRSYLRLRLVPPDVAEEVEGHLTVGADPLLSLLLGQTDFVDSYFQHEPNTSEQDDRRVGFVLLSNVVLKKLLHCDRAVQQLWHNNDRSILSKIFSSLEDCHTEMCLELEVGSSESSQLYEATLTHVAAFVVCCPADEFHLVERLLLESILQPAVWRAMLASDVWCVLARYGSSRLCLEHVCYLVAIMQGIPSHVCLPEKTYLSTLVARLFPLLCDKSKSEVLALYPPSENIALWETLQLKHLTEKLKCSYADEMLAMTNVRIETFLHSSASVDVYNSMLESLTVTPSVLESDVEIQPGLLSSLTSNVAMLWRCATLPEVYSSEETSVKGSHWLRCFTSRLCRVTSSLVLHMDNSELLQVLPRLQTILPNTSSSVKILAMGILKALSTKFFEADRDQLSVLSRVSQLFFSLLEDDHALVRQTALETFALFAYVTKHESVVAMTVDGRKALGLEVASYLQKVASGDKRTSYEEYLAAQARLSFAHKCASTSVTPEEDDVQCNASVLGTDINSSYLAAKRPKLDAIVMESDIDPGDQAAKRPKLDASDTSVMGTIVHIETDIDPGDQAAKRPNLIASDTSVSETVARMERDANFLTAFSKENALPPSIRQAIIDLQSQLGQLV